MKNRKPFGYSSRRRRSAAFKGIHLHAPTVHKNPESSLEDTEGLNDSSDSDQEEQYPGLKINNQKTEGTHLALISQLKLLESLDGDTNSVDLISAYQTLGISSEKTTHNGIPDHLEKDLSNVVSHSPERVEQMWPMDETPPPLLIETSKERLERLLKRNITKEGQILEGRRIISLSSFQKSLQAAMEHGKKCRKDGVLHIVKDNPDGLKSFLQIECIGCYWTWTSDTDEGLTTLPVNEALVWGTVAGGSTREGAKHLCTALEIPFPNFSTYRKHEKNTLEAWETAVMKDLELNGKEEARLASNRGDFVEMGGKSYPYTTVEVDAAWNSRSYGHSFKSKGGVCVIIGKLTNKILFLGVRNRFCYICKRHEKVSIPEHRCFKNYDSNKSAASMEADMILEGFNCSVESHGLIYKRMIGDGDSSVYLTVLHSAKYPGITIEKVECVNHAVKRFNSKLYALSRNTQLALTERKELSKEINRFGKALRSAIEYNSLHNSTEPNLLRLDILNIPFHIFGDHHKCRQYFCKEERKNEENRVPLCKSQRTWIAVGSIVLRAANIADRLIHNMKSNTAESFMNRVAKFNAGKRVNFTHRSGWHLRTSAAALSYDTGPHFYADAFKLSSGVSPQILWRMQQARSRRVQSIAKPKMKGRKLYFTESVEATNSRGPRHKVKETCDKDYGPNASYPDVDEGLLTVLVGELVQSLQVSVEERERIALQTIGQSASDQWRNERAKRITASISGKIYTMRDTTNNTSTLNSIIRPTNLSHIGALEHGRINELHAKKAYMIQTSNVITDCGLFVCLENGIFAASPDGLIGEDGIVEIKCPASMVGHDPKEMPTVMKSSYLRHKSKTDLRLELRKSHAYYYQVITQIYCTGRKWCDFVVYSFKGEVANRVDFPLFIERIHRNSDTDKLWNKMKFKLERFYLQDLAPELVDSRHERNMSYRQPEYRRIAMNQTEKSKEDYNSKKDGNGEFQEICWRTDSADNSNPNSNS